MKKLISVLIAVALAANLVCLGVMADKLSYGDVDSDGKIASADALLIMQRATGLVEFTQEIELLADVNADKTINSSDALLVLQMATNLIDTFPAQEAEKPSVPSTTEEILDFYKMVALENADVVTVQSFDLLKLDLGNPISTAMIKPLAKLVIDANTGEVNGFPGDAQNITVEDIASATYVVNEDSTVTVTLAVNSQTDGLEGEKYGGPVGKSVGVIGNIPQVLEETGADEFADASDASAELKYENASVKVTVNENMELVKGKCTWEYTLYGKVENADINYKPLGISINDASGTATVDYKKAY